MVQIAGKLYDDIDDLGSARVEWDELAISLNRPFASPAWVVGWWAHLRPAGMRLRLMLLNDGEDLVGVVPLVSSARSYLSMGGGLAPVEILALPGLEGEVAAASVALLAKSSPPPATLELDSHGSSPDWPALLGAAWPGGAWRWPTSDAPAPLVGFGDGFDAWMASRSRSFRREMGRKQRKLEQAGGSFRHATADTLQRDVDCLLRMHRQRLAARGGSRLDVDGIERMLVAVGVELLASGRFRLLSLDLDGETIAAQLLLAAGEEVSAWSIGFDAAHAKLSPAMLCMIHSLADAARRGERTMSFGPGDQDYKYRLSNGEDSVRSEVIVPRGAGYSLARLRLLPRQARRELGRRLPPRAKDVLRRLADRWEPRWH